MDIKMLVTDLDRTLLRGDKSVSDYSAEVLRRCRERGLKVVFATARPKRAVMKGWIENIPPADALIVHNGAIMYAGGEFLGSFGIDSVKKDDILRAISRDFPDVKLSVEIDDVLYANFDVTTIWQDVQRIKTDFTDLPDKPADKIIVGVSSLADMRRFERYVPDDLYMELSDGKLALIMNRKATKWAAVQAVAAHFDIPTEKIAAFGDDFNDVGMLRGCGVGVAVSNAIDEAKAAADYVCWSNEEDGVAKWIERNVL